jgi:pimeloyl-[acyl-carrier protein] methyl ester esterase
MRQHNLVFLPGWGYQASVLTVMAPYFSDMNLHFCDLPDRAALSSFADALPRHATLIAWSLGGLTAIRLCAQFPAQFTRLILLASSPKFTADADWPGIQRERAHTFLSAAQLDIQQTIHHFHQLVSLPSASRLMRKHLAAHAHHTMNRELLLAQLHDLFAADLRIQLKQLSQPTLIINGERDAILPATPLCKHIIPDAGHAFFFTHTEIVSAHIHTFLETSHASP